MSEKKQELRCVWNMGGECDGEVKEVEFFNHQIKVPVCEGHVEQHTHVMILHKNGYDVEEILQETAEWRKGEVLTLQLSGLDDCKDVEL